MAPNPRGPVHRRGMTQFAVSRVRRTAFLARRRSRRKLSTSVGDCALFAPRTLRLSAITEECTPSLRSAGWRDRGPLSHSGFNAEIRRARGERAMHRLRNRGSRVLHDRHVDTASATSACSRSCPRQIAAARAGSRIVRHPCQLRLVSTYSAHVLVCRANARRIAQPGWRALPAPP